MMIKLHSRSDLQTSLLFSKVLKLLFGILTTLFLLLAIEVSTARLSQSWAWQYEAITEVRPGQNASISIVAPRSLRNVIVRLKSDRSKRVIKKRIKTLAPKRPYKVSFKPPKGLSHWMIEVDGKNRDGGLESVVFEIDVLSAGPLSVKFFEAESQLESGRLVFSSTRPLERIEIAAFGDEGTLQWADKVSVKLLPNHKIEAHFEPREDVPRRLELKVFDTTGSWQSFRVVRWYAAVPHEDVLFESGSADVKESELPKLREAQEAVMTEIERFRVAMGDPNATVELQLYVAGYTDTVGDKVDNQKLSTKRALSISRAFRQLGIQLQIRYAGFGEDALLVQTPDSTEESKNRRALYIVANTPPAGIMFPKRAWRSLK
jgi:hypothetical protein